MRKTWKSSALLLGTAMLGAVALSGTNAMAGDVTVDLEAVTQNNIAESSPTSLNFGTVDMDPGGDEITIDALGGLLNSAGSNPAAIINGTGHSASSGFTAGVIHIASALALDISVTYPATATIIGNDGASTVLTISDIDKYSGAGTESGVYHHTAVATGADIYVGGTLTIPAGTPAATYTSTMNVTVNY